MLKEQVKTVMAIADYSEALPALAAAQVIETLLDIPKKIVDKKELEKTLKEPKEKLPKESVILLTEAQLINHLGFLRLNGFDGAVIVITFSGRSFDDLKKEYPILTYGGINSHNVWGYPWQVVELLEKVTKIQYLVDGNLKALQKNLQVRVEYLDRQLTEVLLPNLQRLSQTEDLANFTLELDTLENTFNTMLASNSDVRHYQIQLRGSDRQNISFHFQSLMQNIRSEQSCSFEQAEDLRFIFTQWRARAYRTVEGLAGFKSA